MRKQLNLFKCIMTIFISICSIFISTAGVHAENIVPNAVQYVDVEPRYTMIPVNETVGVYASGFDAVQATVTFHINGTVSKNSIAVTDYDFEYSYYVSWKAGCTSCSLQSASVQYSRSGSTLYCVCSVVLQVTSNGKTGIISGTNSIAV